MDAVAREELERNARTLADNNDFSALAALLVRGYGPEILGFLIATHRDEQDASDVFSDFSESIVRGLPQFAWHCSLRTWAYAVARNASHTHRRNTQRRRRRHLADPVLEDLVEAVRTTTLTFLKTKTKRRLDEIRDALPPDDRELLILRLDRGLDWNDLAVALHEGEETLAGDALKRESARLRKRFQLLKDRLREMARREGLLGDE